MIAGNLKDILIPGVAEELELPEHLCDRVVSWAYKDAKEACSIYTEIELSGFGKLMVSAAKLKRRIGKYENMKKGSQLKLTQGVTGNWEKRIKGLDETLDFLNKRVKQNGFQDDHGRVAQPSVPSEGN